MRRAISVAKFLALVALTSQFLILGQGNQNNTTQVSVEAFDFNLTELLPIGDPTECQRFVRALETSGGVLTIPQNGCKIDDLVQIQNSVIVDGLGNRLYFSGQGGLEIRASDVSFANVKFIWIKDTEDENRDRLIDVMGDRIYFLGSEFVVSVSPRNRTELELRTKAPTHWLFVLGSSDIQNISDFKLEENDFISQFWYGVGVLRTSETTSLSEAKFQKNEIRYFHSAIYASRCRNCLITENYLYRVSFGNIVLGFSEGTLVEGNQLVFPGNGTSGDGITASYSIKLTIRRNTIVHASCYGIALLNSADDVLIEQNYIAHGITSAIYISNWNAKTPDLKNIAVRENTLVSNRGWGLAAIQAESLEIEGNVFQDDEVFLQSSDYRAHRNFKSYEFSDEDVQNPSTFGKNLEPYEF